MDGAQWEENVAFVELLQGPGGEVGLTMPLTLPVSPPVLVGAKQAPIRRVNTNTVPITLPGCVHRKSRRRGRAGRRPNSNPDPTNPPPTPLPGCVPRRSRRAVRGGRPTSTASLAGAGRSGTCGKPTPLPPSRTSTSDHRSPSTRATARPRVGPGGATPRTGRGPGAGWRPAVGSAWGGWGTMSSTSLCLMI